MTTETGLPENVAAALKRGTKVEAINLLRAQTGVGLKEAKDAVDATDIDGPAKSPGQVAGAGYFPWMIVLVVIALLAYTFLRK